MAERKKLDVKSVFTMLLHSTFLAMFVFQSWFGRFFFTLCMTFSSTHKEHMIMQLVKATTEIVSVCWARRQSHAKALSNWFG